MNLGDFFKNAPYARPVNPKPVTFTAIAKGEVLPGGTSNPSRRPVAAKIKAAFSFLGGDGAQAARIDTRKVLANKYQGLATDDDYYLELTCQILWRVLHEYDDKEMTLGGKLFPDVDSLREMIESPEANKLIVAYNKYVQEEHPEDAPEAETFRKA
jgi:hypothetical protein